MNDQSRRVLFGPIVPISQQPDTGRSSWLRGPGQQATSNVNQRGKPMAGLIQGITTAHDFAQAIAPQTVQDLKDSAKAYGMNKVDTVTQKVRSEAGRRRNDPGSGRVRKHSSGYSLSKAPNPMAVNLDSGIPPNTYTSDYLDAKENECSPLHLTHCLLQFPTASATRLKEYFEDIIAFDLQTKAQANVGFNLNVNGDFSKTKIITAMNNLLNALQVYFFYMSIISYTSDPGNKNEGMIYLRNLITPTILESLSLLGRRLEDTPCPPKLLELARYISGNFYSGDNQGSAIIKIIPHKFGTISPIDSTSITGALTLLTSVDNNGVFTLLRRAVPQWNPKVLYDVPTTPMYDTNYTTIWANLPFVLYSTTQTTDNYPKVASSDATISYNSFSNTLDGMAYALTGAWDTVNSAWIPGLMAPTAQNTTPLSGTDNTRKSFAQVSGSKSFNIVYSNTFLTRSRLETYYNPTTTQSSVTSCHLPGADKCMAVSADTIRETTMKVIDYLMSADTIVNNKLGGVNRAQSQPNNPSRPQRRSRKSK